VEIARGYICPYKNCGKPYGSEGSMNLHMKLKHHGGNKTDRDKLAKQLIYMYQKKTQLPEALNIHLPPGSIYEAQKEYGSKLTLDEIDFLEGECERLFKGGNDSISENSKIEDAEISVTSP